MNIDYLIDKTRRLNMKFRRDLFRFLNFEPRYNFFLDSPVCLPRTDVTRLEIYAKATKLTIPHLHHLDDDVIYSFQRRHLYEIKNAIIDPCTGMVYDENGKFIAESMAWEPTRLLSEVPRPKISIPKKNNRGVYLFLPSTPTYFHWLLQDLAPFIVAFKKYPKVNIVTGDNTFKPLNYFITNYLKQNNIIKTNLPFRVEKLIMAGKDAGQGSPFPPHGCVHPYDVTVLRNYFKRYLNDNKGDEGIKIFLSRRKWSRSFKGESVLEEELKKRGFYIFDGTLDLHEQIKLFSRAKLIVGTSGAAMSNMIWMKENSKVVQLSLNLERYTFYYNLAHICKHDYNFIDINETVDVDSIINQVCK